MSISVIALFLLSLQVLATMTMTCTHSSREYQIVLRSDLLTPSFEAGVNQVVDQLSRIAKEKLMNIKVLRSSLKFNNVSLVRYILDPERASTDLNTELTFKSRRKRVDESADIVTKISNPDPALACVALKVAKAYVKSTRIKFELDIHGENGQIRQKSAHSFITKLPFPFDQTSPVNISSILTNAAKKFTQTGLPIIVVPDSAGKVNMRTAEFLLNLAGEQAEAVIFFFERRDKIKAEFSFKLKGENIDRDVLLAAQQLTLELSELSAIASFASTDVQE